MWFFMLLKTPSKQTFKNCLFSPLLIANSDIVFPVFFKTIFYDFFVGTTTIHQLTNSISFDSYGLNHCICIQYNCLTRSRSFVICTLYSPFISMLDLPSSFFVSFLKKHTLNLRQWRRRPEPLLRQFKLFITLIFSKTNSVHIYH